VNKITFNKTNIYKKSLLEFYFKNVLICLRYFNNLHLALNNDIVQKMVEKTINSLLLQIVIF